MSELKKSLSLFSGTALFLNIVIGSGLLVLPGLVYKQMGGLSLVSWLICALTALPLLFIFIILGKQYPDSGGISHYAYRAFGSFAQRAAAFIFLGAVAFGLPSIAMTGGYYLNAIFPGSTHIYAALIIIFAAILHGFSGSRISRVLGIVGSSVIAVLFILLVIGASGIDADSKINVNELIPKATEWSYVFSPFMMIFFAFTGWEVGSHSAEEFKNAKRDFPRAMIISFVIATAFYAAIALVVQLSNLNNNYEAPFIAITHSVLGNFGNYFVSFVAVVLILANLFGAIWGVSRLVYSLGRDGIMPKFLEATKNGTPLRAVWLTVSTLLFVLLLDYCGFIGIEHMLALAGQNFLLLYGLAAASLFSLTKSFSMKFLAVSVVILVIAILTLASVHFAYPMVLIALASIATKINAYTVKNSVV